jgi:hypothetical protein
MQFGIRIETLMLQQRATDPELSVPRILHALTNQLRLHNCFGHVGVFRVPGRHNVVAALKEQLNRASVSTDLTQILADNPDTDVNALASLLKMWFRELPTPIIDPGLYDVAVRGFASEPDTGVGVDDELARVDRALSVFRELPAASRSVLQYIFRFLDEFGDHAERTKMDQNNLAMMFVPVLIASPSVDINEVAVLAQAERRFVLALMAGLRRIAAEENSEFRAANPPPAATATLSRTSRSRANAVATSKPAFSTSLDLGSLSNSTF